MSGEKEWRCELENWNVMSGLRCRWKECDLSTVLEEEGASGQVQLP